MANASNRTAPASASQPRIVVMPEKVLVDITRLPSHKQAMTFVSTLIEREMVSYQALAKAACPMVSDLKVLGKHLSTCEGLRIHSFSVEDTFADEPELLVSLVRLQQNQRNTPGIRYYASAPVLFPRSADYIFVGESIDVPGMAAKSEEWRIQLLGVRNDSYSPSAVSGSPESIEWITTPNTRAGMEPKSIMATLGKHDPKFLTAEQMQVFLNSAPVDGTKKSEQLTAEDLFATYGI